MIYVASRARNLANGKMWRTLRENGYPIISSWIDEDGEGQTSDFRELWVRIEKEIRECKSLVLYIGEDDLPIKGAIFEVGMAAALAKPIKVCCRVPLDEWSYAPVGSWLAHPLIKTYPTIYSAMEAAMCELEN